MILVGQRAPSVGTHIQRSDVETTHLRTELREMVSTFEAKLDANSTAVENIEGKLNRITKMLEREAKKRNRERRKRRRRKKTNENSERRRRGEKRRRKGTQLEAALNSCKDMVFLISVILSSIKTDQ